MHFNDLFKHTDNMAVRQAKFEKYAKKSPAPRDSRIICLCQSPYLSTSITATAKTDSPCSWPDHPGEIHLPGEGQDLYAHLGKILSCVCTLPKLNGMTSAFLSPV